MDATTEKMWVMASISNVGLLPFDYVANPPPQADGLAGVVDWFPGSGLGTFLLIGVCGTILS